MNVNPETFAKAARAFNTINIAKGQTVAMATCDDGGHPNVAPVGSMRVVDMQTVHVLQGMLPRTVKNLESNPLVAFSTTLRFSILDAIRAGLRGDDSTPLGYRLYARYMGSSDDPVEVRTEANEIVKRIPLIFRGMFAKFCEKRLRRLLKFEITEIRAT